MKTKDAQTLRAVERVLAAALRAVTMDAREPVRIGKGKTAGEALRAIGINMKIDEKAMQNLPHGARTYGSHGNMPFVIIKMTGGFRAETLK